MRRFLPLENKIALLAAGFLRRAWAMNASGAPTDGKRDWEETLAAAKKEGQVDVDIYRCGCLGIAKKTFPTSAL
jgi:hypothetical protein